MEQQAQGTWRVWMEPFVPLRLPLILDLRRDPSERAPITSNTYFDPVIERIFSMMPAQTFVAECLASFEDPPRQKAASFSLDQVIERMSTPTGAR